jgi:hypothetical protein
MPYLLGRTDRQNPKKIKKILTLGGFHHIMLRITIIGQKNDEKY